MNKQTLKIGIQGGKGSFNDEAIQTYLKKEDLTNAEIVYLYTSENVLKALNDGTIDQGQFAIHNTIGGNVRESIVAMGKYHFSLITEYSIPIAHTLMMRKDAQLKDLTTIMTHPQVLEQCKQTLDKKYSHLKHVAGEGDLIDPALVAKHLSEKKLPKEIGTMSTKVLAQIYDLTIVEKNLQDLKENYTNFLLVKKL
jgi:prephenate dehydratase